MSLNVNKYKPDIKFICDYFKFTPVKPYKWNHNTKSLLAYILHDPEWRPLVLETELLLCLQSVYLTTAYKLQEKIKWINTK